MRCSRGDLVFIFRGFRGRREEIWLGQIRLEFMNEVVLKIVLVDHRKKCWTVFQAKNRIKKGTEIRKGMLSKHFQGK